MKCSGCGDEVPPLGERLAFDDDGDDIMVCEDRFDDYVEVGYY